MGGLDKTTFDDIEKQVQAMFDPKKIEQMKKENYKYDRKYPENFSNWYPHIKDFGDFKHVDIVANQIFTYEEYLLFKDEDHKKDCVNKLNEVLKPTLDKMEPMRIYNIKNGCFSNKFNFETCLASKETLAEKLWDINYESQILDTGGLTELVVRKVIPGTTDRHNKITIYNGMPLRNEIRVFYDMETETMEYWVDYWDYKYCKDNIYNVSDKIVFDYFHGKLIDLETGMQNNVHRDFINYVAQHELEKRIKTLKFDGKLEGIWSIDFLVDGEDWYLIDMARGNRSAYWNPNKLRRSTLKRLNKESEEN